MEHPTVFPVLRYTDAHGAIEFLVAAFGVKKHCVYADGDRVHHAEIRLGNGIVMLGSGDTSANESVYVVVDDPDAHCSRARTAGAGIVREPHDTEYGSREYAARDSEGTVWSFGTYQPFAFEHARADTLAAS
jgi:uncharacterized glyoxalase superfamily protein PhnB